MTIELRYDQARTVYHDPKDGIVATVAVATLFSPTSSPVEVPIVTKPTATGTIHAGSTTLHLRLQTGEGASFVVGERIKLTSDGVTYQPTIARIDGDILIARAALPQIPNTGTTVYKTRLTATLSAPGVAQLGTDYRLEWVYNDAISSGYHTEGVSIVRWPWVSPVSADDVRVHLAEIYSDTSRTDVFCETIAARASDKIAQALLASRRRAHLFPDPSRLEDSTWQAVRLLLAEQGYTPDGDAAQFAREMRFSLGDALAEVVKSLTGYDANNDGNIDGDENNGGFWSFRVRR